MNIGTNVKPTPDFPLLSVRGDIPQSWSLLRCPVLVPVLVTSPTGPANKLTEDSRITPENM